MADGNAVSTSKGYVRVAAIHEDATPQIDALRADGVEPASIVVERPSGARTELPLLDELLTGLRQGETVVVPSLGRLGVSLPHLVRIGDQLNRRGAHLRALAEDIDTRRPDGPALLRALTVLSDLEHEVGSRATRDGLAAARVRGKRAGRPPRLDADQAAEAQRLYDSGLSMAQVALRLGVPRTTVYGHVQQHPRPAK